VGGLLKLENAALRTGGKVGDYYNSQGPAFRVKTGRDFWGRLTPSLGARGGGESREGGGQEGVSVVRDEAEEESGYVFEKREYEELQRRLEPLEVRKARLDARRAAKA